MGPCCSKNNQKQTDKKIMKSAKSSVQPTLIEYEFSDAFSVNSKEIDEIDERCADIPTYRPRKPAMNSRRPANVPILQLEKISPEPTPIDEEALFARKMNWANTRQKSFRMLPIASNKEEVSHEQADKSSQTPRETSSKASVSPDTKPPLPPKRLATPTRKSFDFSAVAADIYKSTELLSPSSITSTRNKSAPKGTVRSAKSSIASPRTRDLLALARQQNRLKTEVSPISGASAFSISSRSFGNESMSFSPKTIDIMNSDIASADGDLPQLFAANSDNSPKVSTHLIPSQQPMQLAIDSPRKKLKKSQLIEKQKLDDNKLKINQYILEKQIGKGGYGVVFSAVDTVAGVQRAVKMFNKRLLTKKFFGKSPNALNELRNEIEVLSYIKHPNIIEVFEVIEGLNTNKVFLVLELAELGSTTELSPMSLKDAWSYFKQLISALFYLHEQASIVHRDIKPQNLLINSEGVLKLSDFGASQSTRNGDEFSNMSGTHAFMAPEMLGKVRPFAGKPLDMWASGVSLYYFIIGSTPFKSRKITQLYSQIQLEDIVIPSTLEPNLVDLLKGLLCKDPVKRLTVKEVLAHPWLAKLSFC